MSKDKHHSTDARTNAPEHSELGKTSAYIDQYDAALLFPIARQPKRDEIGIDKTLPFMGADLWTAYELSWLNAKGKPQVALAHVTIPCDSPNIIESKSFKLYLNSLNNTRLEGHDHGLQAVHELLAHDLSDAAGARVAVRIESFPLDMSRNHRPHIAAFDATPLDRLDIECSHYTPAPELLTVLDDQAIEESVYSDLLKSNCLVTGQPDWGSVQISYCGVPINHAGLLQYIVSFRNHNEFHEQCVERIFMDIWTQCQPTRLTFYARYTRRGGLDINPFRTNCPQILPANIRLARQ